MCIVYHSYKQYSSSSSSSSRSALELVLLALQHSHISPEVTNIPINNIYIYIYTYTHTHTHTYIYAIWHHRLVSQYRFQNNWFTSASVFLLSHRILLCAGVVALSEKASTIQYGYRKWGTHARVFSQTLAHGNSKNEIRQRKRGR